MPTLAVTSFLGEMPRMEPRMLESGYAVATVNCCLDRGSLRPLRGAAFMEPLDAPAVAIFKHDIDGWFAWEGEVSAVKSAVADVDGEKPLGHVLVTGERGYPTQRLSGGEIHRLGIPRPSVAPVANVAKEAALATSVFGFCARTHAELPLRYDSEGALVEERNVEVTPYATLEEILTPEKESSFVHQRTVTPSSSLSRAVLSNRSPRRRRCRRLSTSRMGRALPCPVLWFPPLKGSRFRIFASTARFPAPRRPTSIFSQSFRRR